MRRPLERQPLESPVHFAHLCLQSYRIDPNCQNVVSGSVTMITVEGDAVASQLDKLQDEIGKLR